MPGSVARGAGELVASADAHDLEYLQWDYPEGGDSVRLEIVRLDKSRIPVAADACPSAAAEVAAVTEPKDL